jgi:phage tail protein X
MAKQLKMRAYTTQAGDNLDQICYVQLGSEQHLPQLLACNPGLYLTHYDGPLPAGIDLKLPLPAPSVTAVPVKPTLSLFG